MFEGLEVQIPVKKESKEYAQAYSFHHARAFEHSPYGIVMQHRKKIDQENDTLDNLLSKKYLWMESQVGYYPLFMAVGQAEDDIRMTGYQNQWGRKFDQQGRRIDRLPKGEFSNFVLFSFADVPDGIFTDFDEWNVRVLNQEKQNDEDTEAVFKPSWTREDWLEKAKKDPHSVQLVVPQLDLRASALVSVRNKETKQLLEKRGFQNVQVFRIPYS